MALIAPLEAVTGALIRQRGVSDWQIHHHTERSAQLFLIGPAIETRRLFSTERIQTRIYNDHPPHITSGGNAGTHGEGRVREGGLGGAASRRDFNRQRSGASASMVRGATTRALLSEEIADQGRLTRALEEAVFIAGLTDNPPYSLPRPLSGLYPDVETVDGALIASDASRMAVLGELRERLLAAVAAESGIRLSSAELYATSGEVALRSSQGIDIASSETDLFCDLVLIAGDSDQAAEYHAMPQRRRLADLNIEEMTSQAAQYARDSLRAEMPATHEGPVVISGEALVDLFSPLIFHSSARAAYQSMSRLQLGQPISGEQDIDGDRLTFISNALLPYGTSSAPFSEEGLPGERLVIVQDHLLQSWWAEQRYADYLHIRPTGSFANIEIPAGAHPVQDLLGNGPVYHLVAFSWLNPDELTGDFVAEIKLGYRVEHGQTTPIKGGSLSGNLFEALGNVRLSRETQFTGNYSGPAALHFERLTIAGA
ncbi:MAG TPA: metallopeptidase TldD-related protein [Ktedonobacterales bacterium]|nr:metallopeptidase TldD-related protein [Ktedonobacterales bacterium]